MKKTTSIIFALSLFFAQAAQAKLLFEGWFQVMLGSKKIGYLIEKYEFDNNKFKATTYLKTNADGNNVTESLKAVAGPDLSPVSYEYTSKVGDQVKVIDASFKGDTMTLNNFDGTKKTQNTKRIKKGTFLSTFLIYLILSQKSGLKVGNDFKYYAIAEEDGTAYVGSALVKNQEPVRGRDSYRIINEFKGDKFLTWVSPLGEPLLTRQPDRNIDVRFATTQSEATEGLPVNKKDLELLFGTLPGSTSPASTPSAKPPAATPSKFIPKNKLPQGAAQGTPPSPEKPVKNPAEGLEIKGVPPPPPTKSE